MSLLNLFRNRKTFRHGVHPVEHKDLTEKLPIRRLSFSDVMVIPLLQHRGAPAKAIVTPGQEVVRGEPIAEADGLISVPMHSPVTGRVRSIDALVPTAEGPRTTAIVIDTYAADSQEVLYSGRVDSDTLTADQLVTAVQHSGMVGLGGAAFPSHVKLLPPKGSVIDTLVINGCECEPYLTCDHRVMLEQTDNLLQGIRMVLRATGAHRAIIGVEDNKRDAVEVIRQHILDIDEITCEAVETKYPQGAEKMLINSLLDLEVPSGGLPTDIGVAVYNVGTVAQLGELIPDSRGLIERVVTVSGCGIERPGNYLVPIGTPLHYLLAQVGATLEANEIIMGGPMMGMAVASQEVAITKGVSGVVVLEKSKAYQKNRPVSPCIQCGACLDACPLHLNPSHLGKLAGAREYKLMETEFFLNECFECGSCSYVCPSSIPLTQYFRIAKAINREEKAA